MIADEIHAGDLLRVLPDIMEISDTEATPKKKRKEKKLKKRSAYILEYNQSGMGEVPKDDEPQPKTRE